MSDFRVVFSLKFKAQGKAWLSQDSKTAAKIKRLMDEIVEHPFEGIGKPEKLINNPYWSRRIDKKHRLVYRVEGNVVYFISCHGHYGDH